MQETCLPLCFTFQHYHHHPITLHATTYRSGRQKLLVYRMCPQQMCAKIIFSSSFLLCCRLLINKGDGITFGHSFIQSLLLRIKGQQQPIILVSFDTLHMFAATGSLKYTSECNNTKAIFASISMHDGYIC